MSPSMSPGGPAGAGVASGRSMLRVQAVFRDVDERRAQTIASELIDRVHELANLPEFQCDVDVVVQVAPGDEADSDVEAPPGNGR